MRSVRVTVLHAFALKKGRTANSGGKPQAMIGLVWRLPARPVVFYRAVRQKPDRLRERDARNRSEDRGRASAIRRRPEKGRQAATSARQSAPRDTRQENRQAYIACCLVVSGEWKVRMGVTGRNPPQEPFKMVCSVCPGMVCVACVQRRCGVVRVQVWW